MKRLLKIIKLWLTFWVAGACLLAGVAMVALCVPPRPTQRLLALAARLMASAQQQAIELYGYNKPM